MLYIDSTQQGQLAYTLEPPFHAHVVFSLCIYILTYYTYFYSFIGWSSDWFTVQYIFRISYCSPSFSYQLEGHGAEHGTGTFTAYACALSH